MTMAPRCPIDQQPCLACGETCMRKRIQELEALVYVPGQWRCAKCNLNFLCTVVSPAGAFANTAPQTCPNGCGPAWRVTERDVRREAQKLFDKEFDAHAETKAKLAGEWIGEPNAPTFPFPREGIVCFHCGKRFHTPGAARLHFGQKPNEPGTPKCTAGTPGAAD